MSAFFDTNILVYAFSNDPKQDRAENLMAEGGVISVQVLNEFANVLLRKQKQTWEIVDAAIETILDTFGPPVSIGLPLHRSARSIAKMHRLGIYDALIVAAALEAGCATLYSEDLNHSQRFGQVEIVNPFLAGHA